MQDLDEQESDLIKQIQTLQYKLQALRDERQREIFKARGPRPNQEGGQQGAAITLPSSVETLCEGFRNGQFSKTQVAAYVNAHWGTDRLTYKGRSFFDACQDLITDTGCEDSMCHGFLNLSTGEPVFVNDQQEDVISRWRRDEMAICIFAK